MKLVDLIGKSVKIIGFDELYESKFNDTEFAIADRITLETEDGFKFNIMASPCGYENSELIFYID